MQVNAANAIGMGLALLTASSLQPGYVGRLMSGAARKVSWVTAPWALLGLLIVGSASLVISTVHDLSGSVAPLPGVVRFLGGLSYAAIFLAALAPTGKWWWTWGIAYPLTGVMLGIGLLLLNKSLGLLAVAAVGLGRICRQGRGFHWNSLLWVGLLTLAYILISGPVTFGRNLIGLDVSAPDKRWWAVVKGFEAVQARDPLAESSALGRLNYLPSQAAALDLWDKERGADDFGLLPWLVAPRVAFPEKPVLTQTPEAFHYKVTGQHGTSTGQGVFISGYYSGGWIGLLAASAIAGWTLLQTSTLSRSVVAMRAWILTPLVFQGMLMAFRIDGSFLTDYAGSFLYIFGSAALLSLLGHRRGMSGWHG